MEEMNAYVSVIGMDKKGIIKEVATVLSENGINILDINQTIVQDCFTMVMFVDLEDMKVDLKNLKDKFNDLAEKLELRIKVQHEDIFAAMHKI
jgi:ACT domain-containing protein